MQSYRKAAEPVSIDLSLVPQLKAALSQRLAVWSRRLRERHELASLSSRELQDMGISTATAWSETHKPFWQE